MASLWHTIRLPDEEPYDCYMQGEREQTREEHIIMELFWMNCQLEARVENMENFMRDKGIEYYD